LAKKLAHSWGEKVSSRSPIVDQRNVGSIGFHEKLGFTSVGLLPEVGMKFGRWLDLAFLQLKLDERATPDGS